ncbi:MAG TPA: hypothetical protein VFC01_21595, partial [Mycobacterium sp.]|nr:hypothetical protein [Mycobacterium sp.]
MGRPHYFLPRTSASRHQDWRIGWPLSTPTTTTSISSGEGNGRAGGLLLRTVAPRSEVAGLDLTGVSGAEWYAPS